MAFMDHFGELADPRSHINRRHDLHDILFLTVAAILARPVGWKGIKEFGDVKLAWLRQFRGFEAGIPVDDTIARIISALMPAQFPDCFVNWVNELRAADGKDVLTIDGKTFRRSHDGNRKSALHMLSVWPCKNRLVLGQSRSAGNEE